MNYDQMEAGPEMDRLVAEKVMGWTWGLTGADFEGWCGAANHGEFDRRSDAYRGRWEPSRDIAHAWEVVERMTCTTKESWEFYHTTTMQTAVFEYDGGRDRPWKPGQYTGDALSMPLAICRAALKAVHV